LLDHQKNYVGNSSMINNVAKNFDILTISLSWSYIIILIILHNYFDSLTKLFSDLYRAKFL